MWGVGQWLWDRELKQPVQFHGIAISSGEEKEPAQFMVIEPVIEITEKGETTEAFRFRRYGFDGAEWWQTRYSTLYIFDKDKTLADKIKVDGLKIALST